MIEWDEDEDEDEESIDQIDMRENHMGDTRVHATEPQQQSLQGLVSTLLVMSCTTSQRRASREAKMTSYS